MVSTTDEDGVRPTQQRERLRESISLSLKTRALYNNVTVTTVSHFTLHGIAIAHFAVKQKRWLAPIPLLFCLFAAVVDRSRPFTVYRRKKDTTAHTYVCRTRRP